MLGTALEDRRKWPPSELRCTEREIRYVHTGLYLTCNLILLADFSKDYKNYDLCWASKNSQVDIHSYISKQIGYGACKEFISFFRI